MDRKLFGLGVFVLLAAGCTPAAESATASDPPKGCVARCEASGGAGQKICGTDHQTYDSCSWDCHQIPQGVAMFPGACQDDGSPAADAPAAPADGDLICDYIKVGTSWQPIECADDLGKPIAETGSYLDGEGGRAFVGAVDEAALPVEVDHRSRFGAVKTQGGVSSCTAFAMTAALEGTITSSIGQRLTLSEMHLWSRYHTPDVEACASALDKGGIASRADADANGLAYEEETALAWEQSKSTPDGALVSKVDGLSQFEVVRVDPLGTNDKPTAAATQKALAAGLDVFVAMYTSDAWNAPQSGVITD